MQTRHCIELFDQTCLLFSDDWFRSGLVFAENMKASEAELIQRGTFSTTVFRQWDPSFSGALASSGSEDATARRRISKARDRLAPYREIDPRIVKDSRFVRFGIDSASWLTRQVLQ